MAFPVQAVLPKDKNAAQEVKPVINEPLLMTLLSSKAEWDFDHSSDFFCTLSALNTRNEFDLNFYCTGHAVAVFCDKKNYVVVLLSKPAPGKPATETRKIILFDEHGKFLDSLSCSISSRYGTLLTGYPKRDEDDGAQFVIRFVTNLKSKWHNWHTITHGENKYTFEAAEKHEPIDWVNRGLVRVAIKNGKFRILFPEVNEPENKEPKK